MIPTRRHKNYTIRKFSPVLWDFPYRVYKGRNVYAYFKTLKAAKLWINARHEL